MISIIFLYSPDRKALFGEVIDCLYDLDLFDSCQKIICADNLNNLDASPNFEIEVVPRINGEYCWADAINAGVAKTKHEIFLYLDCDRVLPTNYLKLCLENIGPKKVLYSEKIFQLKMPLNAEEIRKIRDGGITEESATEQHRLPAPIADYGMTPFSGNTCMLKEDYIKSGGFDSRFRGYGFPDIDYYFKTTLQGFQFIKLEGTVELHQHHAHTVSHRKFIDQNTWNAYKFCKKWLVNPSDAMALNFKDAQIDINLDYPDMASFFANRAKRTLFL